MKRLLAISLLLITCLTGFASCNKNDQEKSATTSNNSNPNDNPTMSSKIKIIIGSHVFTATLFDNATATAFAKLLPLNISMTELNGNEKYFDLPSNLPSNATHPGAIHSGDLMLYGSGTLVLFYKDFSTPYTYTRLAKVDDASGLAAALGSDNIRVEFSSDK